MIKDCAEVFKHGFAASAVARDYMCLSDVKTDKTAGKIVCSIHASQQSAFIKNVKGYTFMTVAGLLTRHPFDSHSLALLST